MEKTHYYFGWFSNGLPKDIADLLDKDLGERKSLVTICTRPAGGSDVEIEEYNLFKNDCLAASGIVFDEYHFIDYKTNKDDAQELLKNASATAVPI